jgi:peptidyl-prolyl cis-trans isomerase A (cyclophilin A)
VNEFRRLLGYTRPYRGRLTAALAAMVVYGVATGAIAYLIQPIFDQVLFRQERVLEVTIAIVVAYLIRRLELFADKTPKTVANFVELAEGKREWKHPVSGKKSKDRLYDGTIFHRVIPNFMIQGGDPAGTGFGGPGYQFEDETKGSPHKFDKPGKLAMANSGPNTNGSQFFITIAPTQWLTGKHTIFGEVVEGYEVAEKIVATPRNRQDKPLKDAVVKSVVIEKV